jgi:putative DNA primase/helicase
VSSEEQPKRTPEEEAAIVAGIIAEETAARQRDPKVVPLRRLKRTESIEEIEELAEGFPGGGGGREPPTLEGLGLAGDAEPPKRKKAKASGPKADMSGRRPIRLVVGEAYRTVSAAEEALLRAETELYQRGTRLVRPVLSDVAAAKGRRTKVGQLLPVSPEFLADVLSRHTVWTRWDEEKKEEKGINPPMNIVKMLLARSGHWAFKGVSGIIMTPTLRPDGTLLNRPGFDEETGLVLMDPPVLPPMDMEPSKDQAVEALGLLKGLLVEFPLTDRVGCAVALSAQITPVVRIACPVVPAHAVKAPTPGSGKSYLLNTVAAICTGHRCPMITVADRSETEKRIASAVIAGQPIIALDNVDVTLGGAFLSQVISEEVLLIRKFGVLEQFTTSNNWVVFITGNNLQLSGDVASRRVLLAEMDAGVDRPHLRQFKGRPYEKVLANRGRYVAAALTIVLAYRAAGMPGVLPRLAGFETWSDSVRSALVWLGEADPVESMNKVRDEDPELRTIRQVFKGMELQFGLGQENAKFSHEIIEAAKGMSSYYGERLTGAPLNVLREGLDGVAGPTRTINPVILGVWLGTKVNRVVDGLCLRQWADNHSGTLRWWVERKGE